MEKGVLSLPAPGRASGSKHCHAEITCLGQGLGVEALSC